MKISCDKNATPERDYNMSSGFVKIDLHGLRQEEAMKVIDKAIASAGPATYQLQLIHGYNRGTRSPVDDI